MNQESAQTPPLGFNGVSPSLAPAAIPVDELAFGLLINRALGGSDSRRPSDKSANEVQVDMVLGQAQNLAKMNEQYVETYVVRGTKELYALLGAIYNTVDHNDPTVHPPNGSPNRLLVFKSITSGA